MEPTHELVVDPGDHPSEAVIEWINEALFAALRRSDEVEITVNMGWLDDDLPELADDLRSSTVAADRVGKEMIVRRGAAEDIRTPLSELLDRTSVHRHLAIESVRLLVDGYPVAKLHPESDRFELDADRAPGIDDVVRTAIKETPARLVETEILAEWEFDERSYQLRPPYLRDRSRRAFHLVELDTVTVDAENEEIILEWSHSDRLSSPSGLLERARSMLFKRPSPPERIKAQSETDIETVASAFERLDSEYGFTVQYRKQP